VKTKRQKRELALPEIGPFGLLKHWLVSTFFKVNGTVLPKDRSSQEAPAGNTLSTLPFATVIAPFDFQMLKVLKKLWLKNPDFSQYVMNVESLGNTGHSITVDAASDSQAEAALVRINESASRVYANGAGVDGLINAYLDQLAWAGAISSEDVVDLPRRRVDQVVIVPVEQIRFRYLEGRYVPHQQPGTLTAVSASPLGLIPLNAETYRYYAVQTMENSPYAKPPATAAVDIMCGPQQDSIDNLGHIVQKFGILGLIAFLVKKPPAKPGELDNEYKSRLQTYLTNVRDTVASNFNKGLLVGWKGEHEVDHANVASDGRGAAGIFQIIEELAFSGMGSMAAFHGRNYTTTETFADVIYSILSAQVLNRQRLVKRRQERTYVLDLMLAGIPFDGLSLQFNGVEARNELQKAEAEQIRQAMVLERARTGIISPDQAAQELGYDAAFDPELLSSNPEVAQALRARFRAKRGGVSATCRFDRNAQRYRFLPSRIELAGDSVEDGQLENETLLPFKKKAA
jgi:hypothetical protein